MRKYLLLLLISFLPVCSGPSDITVILDWTVNTNHTGLIVAVSKGYFQEEGLKVNVQNAPEVGTLSILAAGKAQFAFSYQEELTFARTSGLAVKAVAAVIQHNTSGFASLVEKKIVIPRDFEGKNYGGWGSPVEEATIRALMEKDGGDFKKVNMMAIGSMDFFAAVSTNVDFAWIFEGWDKVAAEIKGVDINFIRLRDQDPALDYYTPVIAATDDFLTRQPQTARKFLRAVARGYEFAIAHPREAAEILLAYAPELDGNLVRSSQRFLAGEYRADSPKWGYMKLAVWENYAVWLVKNGLLEGKFQAAEAFTNEFLP